MFHKILGGNYLSLLFKLVEIVFFPLTFVFVYSLLNVNHDNLCKSGF